MIERLVRVIPVAMLAAVGILPQAVPAAAQIGDDAVYSLVLFDQLEYSRPGEGNPVSWDMIGWVGGDFTRFWIKSEGDLATVGSGGEVKVQALYSRLIDAFWELQVGAELDVRYGAGDDRTRVQAVVGLEGLAPYWFELEPALLVSQDGDVSVRITATYDMFVTQRLIAQPRIDASGAVQEVPEFGVGSGFNDLGLGFRLRYELRREFAPYAGISWTRRFGNTADLASQVGETVSDLAVVSGARVWF